MADQKKLAVIGASYLQLPLIEKAREMGYETHVFAWAANDVGERKADVFYPISIVEKEAILEKCREIGICGICSIASDLAVVTVNHVACALGLPGNSLSSTRKSTNKHEMRRAFETHGDPSPRSVLVDGETDLSSLNLAYPAIVKPTDRSGSRGITRIASAAELEGAVRDALAQSLEKKALIEEFAEGTEYSVEHISWQGTHHFLAVTLKYTTGAPHFIETGHLEPAPLDGPTREKVRRVVEHALDSLEIRNGASHAEVKIDASGTVRIIEIGARMGGDCIGTDLVRYSTGIDFVKAVIDVAVGNPPDLTPLSPPRPVEIRYILTRADLEEYERIRREEPERILRAEEIHRELLEKASDSSTRAGCYLLWR